MKKIYTVSATEARNNFFTLINESYLEKKRFLVEKSNIPVAFIVPVTSPLPSKNKDKHTKNLQVLKEVEKIQKELKDTGDSTVLLRYTRKHGK